MIEATIWGVKNLKKVEKTDHSTGVTETIKRCTGVIEFPVLAKEAGVYEDEKVKILTEGEYEELINGRFDINKKTAIEYAKSLLEEAHSRLSEQLIEEEIQ